MGMELKEHREVRRRYSNDMEGYTQEKQETEQNRGRRSRYMIITVNRKNYNQYLRDRSISMDWKERDLDLKVFLEPLFVLVGVVYIISRCLGKYFGAMGSAKMTHCSPDIVKYLGITLENVTDNMF